MNEQIRTPMSDESLMAAISHFFGFLIALIVWIANKDKSRFVRYQAVQAMAFDVAVSVIMFLLVGCILVLIFGALALGIVDIAILGSQNNPTAEPFRTLIALMTGVPFLIPCSIIPLAAIVFIARLIATIQTFQGKNFHYPWLGTLVERTLENG